MAGSKNEMTATFQSGKGSPLKIYRPKLEKTPKILEAYWCDENEAKTTLLAHKANAYVLIKAENLDGKKVTIKVFEYDTGESNDDFIHEYEWTYSRTNMRYFLDVSPEMFVKGEEDLVHFYFTLAIEDADPVPYCNADDKHLKIHLVRYVPEIMTSLGWDVGAKLQDEWFGREANDDPDLVEPDLSIVKMDWALGFSDAKAAHDSIFTRKLWVSTNGKPALIKEIKRMVTDGIVTLPTKAGSSAEFGVFRNSVITHKHKKAPKAGRIPTFDKYHYNESPYNEGYMSALFSSLDGLTAGLANFVFRMSSGGTITKTETGYTIKVTKVATYVRDSFDFIDEDETDPQTLGYWNMEKQKVSKTPGVISSGYRHIENPSYRNYRDEFNMGGDYRLFSDLKYTTVSDSFDVTTAKYDAIVVD